MLSSFFYLIFGIIVIGVIITLLSAWAVKLSNPYRFPYFRYSFDVSGKRNVDLINLIDTFLLDERNRSLLDDYARQLDTWEKQTKAEIESIHFKWLRQKRREQYESILDEDHAYTFSTCRNRTRYNQANYIRTPYTVTFVDQQIQVSLEWLLDRCRQLEKTNFEATLKDWNCKQQRRLMTPKLRKKIAERDNYTCQNCVKYMPDGVGLHIDHIIPVIKGGKTVESNLQVLCSKCNGRKGGR